MDYKGKMEMYMELRETLKSSDGRNVGVPPVV